MVALCVGLSAAATVPFYFMGHGSANASRWGLRIPETDDLGYHLLQAKCFYEGLKSGNLYPRWHAEQLRGFGSPDTSFYPPGVYYLSSACYALLRDWLLAALATHLILMIASALSVYLYARYVMPGLGAVFAMIAYIVLPYHLTDQYMLGSMAELLNFVWPPLLLLFTDRMFWREKLPGSPEGEAVAAAHRAASQLSPSGLMLNIAAMAVCYGALVWSHIATAYQFSLFLGLYILMWGVVRRDWRGVVLCGLGVVLGVGLSAAYLYPGYAEMPLIQSAIQEVYHIHYVFRPKAGPGEFVPPLRSVIDQIWIINLAAILVCSASASVVLRRNRGARAVKTRILLWTFIGVYASFMMTRYSDEIGHRIPALDVTQYPWRMLLITTMVAALLTGVCGHSILVAKVEGRKAKHAIAIGVAVLAVSLAYTVVRVMIPTSQVPVHDLNTEQFDDIIPRTAPEDVEALPLVPQATLARGSGGVSVKKWDPQHRELSAYLTDVDSLRVRTFYFPGWTASVDGRGKELGIGDLGEIVLDLEPGTHEITLDFLETPVRRQGRLLNLAAAVPLVGLVGISCLMKRRARRTAERSLADPNRHRRGPWGNNPSPGSRQPSNRT